jgi:hypothetical protein
MPLVRTRPAQILATAGLAMTLAGCGLFGVKGPGLDNPPVSSLGKLCTTPPYELPASCPLGGIGADLTTFKDSHLYAGSTTVIPGSTNFLHITTSAGRVVYFQEQFHANPPLNDNEARLVADGEVPYDGKRVFLKTVGSECQIVEYRSKRLHKQYGTKFAGVLIVLRSADPSVLDRKNIATADISLVTLHSRASFTSCPSGDASGAG